MSSPDGTRSFASSLETRMAEHPWRMLVGAFLVGAWVGLDPPRVPRNRVARAAFAMIGSIAVRVARELALREFLERATRAPHDPSIVGPSPTPAL
ncbi:MAG: hypothetical protein H6Q90_16 [Deltaproteobacteria bacterium]|nr:hypothetical protein [Deltaproteobacteria bacterium]